MYNYFKRFLDIFISFVVIIMVSPILIIVSILILLTMGWPVFFVQQRTTKHEKLFNLYKFRTMKNLRNNDGQLLPDAKRLTKLGAFLRSTSIDELPELINIFFGDMSIIGPRPLLPIYHHYYYEYELGRFSVKGGLIPPEVYYRDVEPTWDNQMKYETIYAQKCSFSLDLKIFFAVFQGLFIRQAKNYGQYERTSLTTRSIQR